MARVKKATTQNKIENLKVEELYLDPDNPRLPEEIQGKNQSVIIRHLFDHANLDELAQSYLDNGVFPHEPLVVRPRKEKANTHWVVEGNRRLATLMILNKRKEAEGLDFNLPELADADLSDLDSVPCFEVNDRESVHSLIGFRHIGGLKTWSPESKARYIADRVYKAIKDKEPDPFKSIAREVGSNSTGIRNPFVAIEILRVAKQEFGIDTSYVQRERFGVWLRCFNSPGIKTFVGLQEGKTFEEIQANLRKLSRENLQQVISDLTPPSKDELPLMDDSRDITGYGRVLQNPKALAALRKKRSLDLAIEIVERADLPSRVRKEKERCDLLLSDLQDVETWEKSLRDAVSELNGVVKSMFALSKSE